MEKTSIEKLFDDSADTREIPQRGLPVIPAMSKAKFIEVVTELTKQKVSGFSMDGLRSQMVGAYKDAVVDIGYIIGDDDVCLDEFHVKNLKEHMNELAGLIGILCCTYNDDVTQYTLMDDVNLPRFDDDGSEQTELF